MKIAITVFVVLVGLVAANTAADGNLIERVSL
jgi:hypothetical protein